MVNYSLGKVYKIESINGGEEGDVYIGSTSLPLLSTRMAQHRCDYKGWKNGIRNFRTSGTLFEKYGVDNCHIVLLESIDAKNKDELFACERKWIKSQKCINKFISGRKKPEYYQDTKETRRIVNKKWREANRVIISIQQNTYDKEHSEAIRFRKKQYYLDNKERILERCRQYRNAKEDTTT